MKIETHTHTPIFHSSSLSAGIQVIVMSAIHHVRHQFNWYVSFPFSFHIKFCTVCMWMFELYRNRLLYWAPRSENFYDSAKDNEKYVNIHTYRNRELEKKRQHSIVIRKANIHIVITGSTSSSYTPFTPPLKMAFISHWWCFCVLKWHNNNDGEIRFIYRRTNETR